MLWYDPKHLFDLRLSFWWRIWSIIFYIELSLFSWTFSFWSLMLPSFQRSTEHPCSVMYCQWVQFIFQFSFILYLKYYCRSTISIGTLKLLYHFCRLVQSFLDTTLGSTSSLALQCTNYPGKKPTILRAQRKNRFKIYLKYEGLHQSRNTLDPGVKKKHAPRVQLDAAVKSSRRTSFPLPYMNLLWSLFSSSHPGRHRWRLFE